MANPWDAVYDQINIYRGPDSVVTPSTDGELDAVEAQLGGPLPRSYRAFLKRFGPGELESTFRLTPVARSERAGWTVAEETLEQREFFGRPRFANASWLGRVVYFGCHAGGEWYVWDPDELASSPVQEAPVYCLRRHDEDRPELVAPSFFEAVRTVLAQVREWREQEGPPLDEGDPDEDERPENAYTPYFVRQKQRPNEAEVRQWLAANSATARDLAFAIRDGGRADAFPILADALQDAGCAHPDLLDACRTGDPDIDGRWVLQVLLGDAPARG